jgi:Na+/H+ antiporter NhaD/arsenite permease-like protein
MTFKEFISNITTEIATTGQNIQFVAFAAHLGIAALVVEHLPDPFYVMLAVFVIAGIKEFVFDAQYEKNPPQTFTDNLQDWLGYAIGACLGYWLAR